MERTPSDNIGSAKVQEYHIPAEAGENYTQTHIRMYAMKAEDFQKEISLFS